MGLLFLHFTACLCAGAHRQAWYRPEKRLNTTRCGTCLEEKVNRGATGGKGGGGGMVRLNWCVSLQPLTLLFTLRESVPSEPVSVEVAGKELALLPALPGCSTATPAPSFPHGVACMGENAAERESRVSLPTHTLHTLQLASIMCSAATVQVPSIFRPQYFVSVPSTPHLDGLESEPGVPNL